MYLFDVAHFNKKARRIKRVKLLLGKKFQSFAFILIRYIYFCHEYVYSNKMPSFWEQWLFSNIISEN